jgi:ribokinase
VRDVIVTRGSEGADWYGTAGKEHFPAIKVDPVDTTGAGDTFTGYVLASLDMGMPMAQAIAQATKAGALMVTRHGTADVIPDLSEVQAFQF